MGDIFGLTDEEQLEVYRTIIDLVKSRLDKAQSFGSHKTNKEGINEDLIIKMVMEKIDGNSLDEFYKHKVLSQNQLSVKNLPAFSKDVSIQQSLFGWRLYSGKEFIECTSEIEAHYLRVWLEAGIAEIKIPQDNTYLSAILLELEGISTKIHDTVDFYFDSITSIKTKDKLRRLIWLEITKNIK